MKEYLKAKLRADILKKIKESNEINNENFIKKNSEGNGSAMGSILNLNSPSPYKD